MSILKIQNDLPDRLDHEEMNPGKKSLFVTDSVDELEVG